MKSSDKAQIGVVNKILLASFECSKYVDTTIFIFLLTLLKVS